ncbi:Calx-beta domain-containing protein [Carboxylicivirga linearis]|uniref:Calx-beta domain-containing protein n=1 Tax=Carboxylicivirga linearis TaxID=1628157 RepID=A0ABS5JZQ9_9BACT|nr:hypothetical protein [Carboxylicivirga linearis]MBS2100397.1 hypothetical protein [Carboxylicivirga linearis]
MKNRLKYIAALFVTVLLMSSCGEEESQVFNDKDAFFAFETSTSAKLENDIRTLRIPVYLAKSTARGEVEFVIETEGFSNPAAEGVDFTIENANNTVIFDGDHYANINVKLIDNEERDGDKKFNVVLKSNSINAGIGLANEANTVHTVTISDNEHPLAALIGYNFEAVEQSIATDTEGNKVSPYVLPVEIRPDTIEGRDDRLLVKGLLGVNQEVRLRFDAETNEVIMEADQSYKEVIDPYFGIEIQLTFFGWEWYVNNEGNDAIKRYPEAIGTYDLQAQEIIFDEGYLAQITGPSDHPYAGFAYNILIIEHCKIAKK